MEILQVAIDLCLIVTLLGLAWGVLFSHGHFRAVVLFIALGLVMALTWSRLAAPEVALAEAAIGAGISGALLLSALPRLREREPPEAASQPLAAPEAGLRPLFCGLLALFLWLPPAWLLFKAAPPASGAVNLVQTLLPESGVSNQVTAVLLNFRSFDTLLELAVLLLAVIGVWSLGRAATHPLPPAGPVLLTLVRGLMPLAILIAGYLVWIGDRAPGGAFQGGAVLGAAGIMLALVARPLPSFCPQALLRVTLVVGLFCFTVIAALPIAGGLLFFQYPPGLAKALILTIEATAALSIGLALCLLPAGGR